MGEKPFLLFGRRSQDKERELETHIEEKHKALAEIKRESANIISEAHRHAERIKKEEQALKALRNEVAKRMKSAEQFEAQLREGGKALSQRESAVRGQEARIERLKNEEGRLRSSLDELQHVYDEKKGALNERQKAIVSLTRELSSLVEKRSEVKHYEATLVSASEKERQAKINSDKMERRVAEGAKLLSDQEFHIEKNKRVLDQLIVQVREMNALKKQVDAEMGERQKMMLAAKRELADMEDAVKDVISTKTQLQQKNTFLVQRDHQLAEQERRIDEKKREIEKLRFDASAAEKSRQELTALLEDKKHVLAELKLAVAQNSQTVKELHEHEVNARKGAHNLEIAQHEADKKLKLLDAKEKEMIRREAAWLEHERALKEAAMMLSKDKRELMDEVNARKAELLLVKQEWEKKFDELEEEKKSLQHEKSDVRSLVESDVLGLKEKEDELVTAIAMFERDGDKLQDEEKSLLKRVAELEKSKAALEREEKALSAKEKRIVDGERIVQKGMKFIEAERKTLEQEKDKVYRSRELKKILPAMERRYEELRKGIGKMEARAIDVGTRPPASRLLKEREKVIEEREEGIHVEMRKLMEREHEVEDLESRKERAFSEYLREEVERARMGKPGREIMNPEIHAMIDDARERVMQGKLDEAVRLVAETEYLIDKVQNQNEKRVLMYDIRDLKASIKLATLT